MGKSRPKETLPAASRQPTERDGTRLRAKTENRLCQGGFFLMGGSGNWGALVGNGSTWRGFCWACNLSSNRNPNREVNHSVFGCHQMGRRRGKGHGIKT